MADEARQRRLPPGVSQLLVQVFGDQRQALLDYAVSHGHGVEIADFISSATLDDGARCAELVAWYRARLPAVAGLVSFHGAFSDLLPGATDAKVLAATRDRISQCLDLAAELGASCAVFHSGFDGLSLSPDYLAGWAERQGAFWREQMAGRTTTLLLENTRERSPAIVAAALDAIGLESVGVCLDPAHAYLRSLPLGDEARHLQGVPPAGWIESLGSRTCYLHISDNDRSYDQHLPPGQGTLDWPALLQALHQAGLRLPAVMEVTGVEGARATEEYLRALPGGNA